jgi:hypothetical protein
VRTKRLIPAWKFLISSAHIKLRVLTMTISEHSEMQTGNNPSSHPEFEERIRKRAYALWEAEGGAHGREDEYWHRARELIEDEEKSGYPPAQSRGHRS